MTTTQITMILPNAVIFGTAILCAAMIFALSREIVIEHRRAKRLKRYFERKKAIQQNRLKP